MTTIVPVRYPLSTHNRRTLDRLAAEQKDTPLVVLHVNLMQEHGAVTRGSLRSAVTEAIGDVNATYVVRSGYVLEDEILAEARDRNADRIVLGKNRRSRIRTLIAGLVDARVGLAKTLRERSDLRVDVFG